MKHSLKVIILLLMIETLVGSQGFQIIELEEDITEEYLIY